MASSQNEVLTEMTNIVGAAFLGVTVGCARCHDHKFDPFRQSDYYRLQAHFAQFEANDLVRASQEDQAAWKAKATPVERQFEKCSLQLRRAPDGQKAQLEMELEKLETRCPASTGDLHRLRRSRKPHPIYVLGRGDYQSR